MIYGNTLKKWPWVRSVENSPYTDQKGRLTISYRSRTDTHKSESNNGKLSAQAFNIHSCLNAVHSCKRAPDCYSTWNMEFAHWEAWQDYHAPARRISQQTSSYSACGGGGGGGGAHKYFPRIILDNYAYVHALFCFNGVKYWPISFKVASLALGQSSDCLSTIETTLKNVG